MIYLSVFPDYYTTLTVLYNQVGVKLSQCGAATEYRYELIAVILKQFSSK